MTLVSVVAAALGGSGAFAQEPASAPLELSVTPYLWATRPKGDVGVGRTEADVDASFSDILDNLNFARCSSWRLRKGRFGLLSDTIYAELEDNAATGGGSAQDQGDRQHADPVARRDLPARDLAARRFGPAGPLAVTVDPYAGIRYTYLDTELTGSLDLPDLGVERGGPSRTSSTGSTRSSACARPGPWVSD